jgi:hypothetical protein
MSRFFARFMLLLVVFMLIGGIAGVVVGIEDFQLSRKTKPQPQVLSAAQLLKQGPGDNQYVRLTDVLPRVDGVVVKGGNAKTYWETAYIPLVPDDENAEAASDAPQIILISKSVQSTEELRTLVKATSIDGILGSWENTLDDKARDLLKETYPKMDPAKCYLLTHNATPPSRAGSFVCMGIGFGLLLGMLILGLTARRRQWGKSLAPPTVASFGVAPLAYPPAPAPLNIPPLPPLSSNPPAMPPPLPQPPRS